MKRSSLKEKYPLIGIGLVATLPILNIESVSLSIILLSIVVLVYLFSDFKERWSPDYTTFFVMIIPFGLYVLGLTYTDNWEGALKRLEIGFPMFVFPVLYFILLGKKYRVKKKDVEWVLNTFVISSSLLTVFVLIFLIKYDLLSDLFNGEMLQRATENRGVNTIRESLKSIPVIGEHPTYLALLALVSGVISVNRIWVDKLNLYLFPLFLTFILLVLSGAKMGMLTAGIISILFFLFSINWNIKKAIVGLVVLVFLGSAFWQVPYLKSRFVQVVDTKFVPPSGVSYNSTNVRIGVYSCVQDVISMAPLVGHGTEGGYQEMVSCYKQYDTDIFERTNYYLNSHNQYLSFVLSNGFYGLVFFVFWLLVFGVTFFRKKKYLYFLIWMTFTLMFLTENLLERQTGVVLFSLLMPLLYKYSIQKTDN